MITYLGVVPDNPGRTSTAQLVRVWEDKGATIQMSFILWLKVSGAGQDYDQLALVINLDRQSRGGDQSWRKRGEGAARLSLKREA